MASSARALCSLLVSALIVHKSEAIMCYYCNSADNPACVDNVTASDIIPVVDCHAVAPKGVGDNFYCRKIVQAILRSGREPEVRVTRGCGWVYDHSDCYTADNDYHRETVCQCFNDHCNSSDKISNTKGFLILTTIIGVILS